MPLGPGGDPQRMNGAAMRIAMGLLGTMILISGCTATGAGGRAHPDRPTGDVVVVAKKPGRSRTPRGLKNVPPGHYPPPGHCRVWFIDRPPGQQPPPRPCQVLLGRIPFGSFVLYGARPWDTRYDWERHARETLEPVPEVVLRLMATVRW